MSIVVIGLNHRTVPLELLERTTRRRCERCPRRSTTSARRPNITEAVVLSTCNRTEVYAVAERFHGAYADVRDFLCELAGLAPEELTHHLYSQHDEAAVAHLFAVAAGLDSAVLGESEILGQVRDAWEVAQGEGSARATLNLLFRHALEVGKRARTETGIGAVTPRRCRRRGRDGRPTRSGGLAGRRVLVVGAGEMGEGMAVALRRRGCGRGPRRQPHLRSRRSARRRGSAAVAVRLLELADALAEVDVLLTSTGARSILVEHADLALVMAASAERPLLVVDVAVPRDVDPGVASIPGVTLLDIDDLRAFADRGIARASHEIRRSAGHRRRGGRRATDRSLDRT